MEPKLPLVTPRPTSICSKKELPESEQIPTTEFVRDHFDGLVTGLTLFNKEINSLKSDIVSLKARFSDTPP